MISPLSLVLAETVAVGPFNPFIITPEWLAGQHVPGAPAQASFDWVDGPSPHGTSSFTLGAFEWEVSFERLSATVESVTSETDAGAAVAKVLELLNHTPVEAVGHNFVFHCDAAEWGGRPLPQLGPLTSQPRFTKTRWSGQTTVDGIPVEFDLSRMLDSVVVVQLSFDHRIDSADDRLAFARAFQADYGRACDLIQEYLQGEAP